MALVELIKTADILPNPFQPRKEFDETGINELAASIRENGLIQPGTVRKAGERYELVTGERRLMACRSLGWTLIPALINDVNDREMAQLALIENIQREDLNAIEEAEAYRTILADGGMTQEQLADKLGKSQSAIANKLRLLNLDESVRDALAKKKITERHGRAILTLKPDQQKKALDYIVSNNLTVKDTEKYIERYYTLNPDNQKDFIKCFGVSTRIAVNTIRQAVNSLRKVNMDIDVTEQDNPDDYVITISIKK